ncbi:hypothetical protein SLS56_000902 [Neofusicoccum ribis]|uniref:USP domain-containing protein n=1 Tax=Neofusicoccum ribis TaxID=45134 RepID=A0ABR3TC43_9PEZI
MAPFPDSVPTRNLPTSNKDKPTLKQKLSPLNVEPVARSEATAGESTTDESKQSVNQKDHSALPSEDDHSADDEQLSHHDSIGASVQRLEIPHVLITTAGDEAANQLVPCKSTAKRRLDELLKNPITFVLATKATMDSEPVRKRRRLKAPQMDERYEAMSRVNHAHPRPDLGAHGLRNDKGLACYRISVLQALMNIPIFVNWVRLHGFNPSHGNCISCALCHLADAYWPFRGQQVSGNIMSALSRLHTVFNGMKTTSTYHKRLQKFNKQEDAHEFFVILMGLISKEMPKSEFEAIFGLKAFWQRTCRKCGGISKNHTVVDDFLTVYVLQPKRGLEFMAYFEHLFKEFMSGLVECENKKCRGKDHDRRNLIIDGPEILLVQINRTAHTKMGREYKVNARVNPPLYLDLSEYLLDARMRRPGTLRYRLTSVVQQAGDTSFGHYTAKVVTPKGIELVNDRFVEGPLPIKRLLMANDDDFTPYILTYLKIRD